MNKETLYRFFEGIASLEEEKQIREWMESSPENERTFFKERKIYDITTLLAHNAITVYKQNRQKTIFREILKIASAILLTLSISYFYIQYKESSEEVAMQTITVPSGQRVKMLLPDGTNIWLNARSTLTYPVSFNKNQRMLELDGEAYFEVAENKKKPFIVKTPRADVEALGTSFNVESYSEREKFETALMTGSVKVTSKENEKEEIILAPDHKVRLENGKFIVEKVQDYTVYRWIEGLICFKDEPFSSMMRELEKCYGMEIQVKNRKVSGYTYTGKFRYSDGIDYALRVLQKDLNFNYSRDHENNIIYIE